MNHSQYVEMMLRFLFVLKRVVYFASYSRIICCILWVSADFVGILYSGGESLGV